MRKLGGDSSWPSASSRRGKSEKGRSAKGESRFAKMNSRPRACRRKRSVEQRRSDYSANAKSGGRRSAKEKRSAGNPTIGGDGKRKRKGSRGRRKKRMTESDKVSTNILTP